MHEISGTATGQRVGAVLRDVRGIALFWTGPVGRLDVVVNAEWAVRECACLHAVQGVFTGAGQWVRRRQVDVVLQQAAVRVVVLGNLGGIDLLGVRQSLDVLPVDRTPSAIKVI